MLIVLKNMEESKKKLIEYWLKIAKEDLKVANSLFEKKHYPQALFFGHLVLEKVLKAYYVKIVDKNAPYTHNLSYLAEKCNLELDTDQEELLEDVSRFNIDMRYPDRSLKFYKMCNKKYTESYLKKIRRFYRWIIKKI